LSQTFLALLVLVILEMGLSFYPGQTGQQSSYFKLPAAFEVTGAHGHTQLFSVEMGSHTLFCLGCPETMTLYILAFHIAWDDGYIPPGPATG
jgi:hypothetical protein